jgi:sugar phosphate isomerase/epimerase
MGISGSGLRIGFSTNVYDNPADIVGTTQAILRDFSDIELELEDDAKDFVFCADAPAYAATVAQLRSALSGINGQVSVHAPYLSRSTNLASSNPQVRAAAIEQVRRCIYFCRDIGGDRVTYHPGFVEPGLPKAASAGHLKGSIETLQRDAESQGVLLCLENMGKERPAYLVYTAEEHLALHSATGTWVTLDLVHLATWCDKDDQMDELMAAYAPITRNIHFNDMPLQAHRHVPSGDGVLPLARMLRKMESFGYRGAAIVDEFARPIPAQRYLSQTRQLVAAMNRG